jgi:FlaA1/EpsC-like NDP-sugar epimerase
MTGLVDNFKKALQLALLLDRRIQRALQMLFDGIAIFSVFVCAMVLRLETFDFVYTPNFYVAYVLILVPTLFILAKMGLYHTLMRYVSIEVAVIVALGSGVSGSCVIIAKLLLDFLIPWSIPVIYAALLFIVITGSRFVLRAMVQVKFKKNVKNVAVYGAGTAGAQLLRSLATSSHYQARMIIDDNRRLQGKWLYGLQVVNFDEASRSFKSGDIDIVLLAMPSINFSSRRGIIKKINEHAIEVKTLPDISSLIDGSAEIMEFKDVAIDDLLGRETVEPIDRLMNKNTSSKVVLVTGAGGSIGSALCNQILCLRPRKLILFDVSELSIYNVSAEIEPQANLLGVEIVTLVGAVQDRACVAGVMQNHEIDTIYHAAAYKHVPIMERNVVQAINNNVIGTLILVEEAVKAKVTSFTLISTDKAVKPTNIMGASKRLAERICLTKSLEQNTTSISIVRFGNVLNSSGSVVPLFKKQIAAGGPITLTHPDVVRYFMTISEAVQLVIQASSLAKGGDVFVLDMGVPIKIKELAFKMVQLSGLRPYILGENTDNTGDIAVKITGLRQGEKMYEELSYELNLIGTEHPRIISAQETKLAPAVIESMITAIRQLVDKNDDVGLIKKLVEFADYNPNTKTEFEATAITNRGDIKQDRKIVHLHEK